MKKSFGQHFLHDKGVIQRIADAVEADGLPVIEVGPGAGALTTALLQTITPENLTLIEADRDLLPTLKEQFPEVPVVFGDAAKVDLDLPKEWVLVGNLPYNAAAAILRHLYQTKPPTRAIIMVQKEQADRMRAKPGEMSLLSLFIQLYTEPKKLFDVGSGAFQPPPAVESTVLLLKKKETFVDQEAILALAKVGFSSRRKQLHRNLADGGVSDSEEVKKKLEAMGVPRTARAQELSVDQWAELYQQLKEKH